MTKKVTSAFCPELFFFLDIKGAASQIVSRLSFLLFHPRPTYPSHVHTHTHIDLFYSIILRTHHSLAHHETLKGEAFFPSDLEASS